MTKKGHSESFASKIEIFRQFARKMEIFSWKNPKFFGNLPGEIEFFYPDP